jgi:hypothetical protein
VRDGVLKASKYKAWARLQNAERMFLETKNYTLGKMQLRKTRDQWCHAQCNAQWGDSSGESLPSCCGAGRMGQVAEPLLWVHLSRTWWVRDRPGSVV